MAFNDTSQLSDVKPESNVTEKYVPGPEIPFPDTSKLIVVDGKPVDSILIEKQCRLLVSNLYETWKPSDGKPFRVYTNVGLFHTYKDPPYVPDVMVVLDVPPSDGIHNPDNRAYFMWVIGKPPDIVIEIVSDKSDGEDTTKLQHYARIGVPFYVIYDPLEVLSNQPLRVFGISCGTYVPSNPSSLSKIGLGLTLWKGEIENEKGTWLRWCDAEGSLLLTGNERIKLGKSFTERANDAAREAATAKKLADELEAKLKQLESQLKKSN